MSYQAITLCLDTKLENIHGTVEGDGRPVKSGVCGTHAAGQIVHDRSGGSMGANNGKDYRGWEYEHPNGR